MPVILPDWNSKLMFPFTYENISKLQEWHKIIQLNIQELEMVELPTRKIIFS